MTSGPLQAIAIAACVGCATAAGVFLSFSVLVMKALRRLPAVQGIIAMQSINEAAVSPVFLSVLFGTAVLCGSLAGLSILWGSAAAGAAVLGSSAYLAGVIGLTLAYHVPRNNALAEVDPASPGAEQHWARYVTDWTGRNHLRTLSSLAAALLLAVTVANQT
jgi:uncharacterized membrane protein